MKILVVGCGFAGAVVARELAVDGHMVTIIDERDHVAGNAYDYTNEHGIRIHKYGPHIFHTNNEGAFKWVTQFGEWVVYKHKVQAQLSDGTFVILPVNKLTKEIVGEENIVDIFYRPYTRNILKRVAVRDDYNEYYFPNDLYQVMPKHGYTRIFEEILDHPRITVKLSVPFEKSIETFYDHVFNSMPIDVYHNFVFGELPYRSLKFHNVNLPMAQVLPRPVINFTNDSPYTRMTEWKNFPEHGGDDKWTTLTYEEPCDYRDNDHQRYYPVKDIDGVNREIYRKYRDLVDKDKMTFIGRCGQYVYIDMHQAVSSSLAVVKKFKQANRE